MHARSIHTSSCITEGATTASCFNAKRSEEQDNSIIVVLVVSCRLVLFSSCRGVWLDAHEYATWKPLVSTTNDLTHSRKTARRTNAHPHTHTRSRTHPHAGTCRTTTGTVLSTPTTVTTTPSVSKIRLHCRRPSHSRVGQA